MLPLPYLYTIPAIIFWGLCVVFVLGEVVVTVRSGRRGADQPDGADQKAKVMAITLIALVIVAALVAAGVLPKLAIASTAPNIRWTLYVVGAVVLAAGIAVRQWSIRVLGRFFTLDVRTEDDQPVVDTGPYRLVSHPSYTGALATYVGIGLALGNWLSLILVLIPLPAYLKRITVEERELGEQLGQPYRDYLSTRRRLLPGIW